MSSSAAALLLEGHWASESGGEGHAVFDAQGIRCANCARSIDTALHRLAGVRSADINVVNSRVSVTWDAAQTSLPAILRTVADLGFRPVPLAGESAALLRRDERRASYKRIGLAGLGSMQVMMYAGGLYTGAFDGIDPRIAEFLKLTCLLFATPVLFYSGAPILRGALQDIRNRVLGMDVTVSLALLLAFLASVVNTLRGSGDVYFDSVVMFIFLLLLGRHAEMNSRHQAANVTDALARALPTQVTRVLAGGATEKVALAAVQVGDLLRVGSGQVVPVDATLEDESALLDEALVTGESMAQRRLRGATLLGGSINAGATLTLRVSQAPQHSTLHTLVRLLERAQSERPRLGMAAQRMASWFIVRILVLTVLVALAWAWFDPSRVLPAVLAVLVATCPCALSLATPVAIAAATSRLARLGVLVTRADAVEGLAQVDTLVLDKTGTVTAGSPELLDVETRPSFSRHQGLAIAAALEAESRHPVAEALRAAAAGTAVPCRDAHEIAGQGIEGSVDGRRWRIGRAAWVAELTASPDSTAWQPRAGDIVLGDATGAAAAFTVADPLRSDARTAIAALRELGLDVQLASGDRDAAVRNAATQLGVQAARGQLRPEQKLEVVRGLQRDGHRVLMVGDGINDGPVLAAADVSAAMGRGSGIAHAASDLLLLRDSLAALPQSIRVARHTLQIVSQNLRWAAAYNLAAVPLAALGFMPPWIAALGMSLSSLVVVANARRINRRREAAP